MFRLGFRQAEWSAPAEWVAGAGGLLPGLPAVPLGSSCGKCSQGTMRRHASPLARHNRAICTQTTEPAIKPTQVNIRRSVGAWRVSRITLRDPLWSMPGAHVATCSAAGCDHGASDVAPNTLISI